MTAPSEAMTLLSATPLFAGVTPGDLEPLLSDFRLRRFATDSYIFREGDPGDHLHLVARGEVKISRTTEAGGEVVFAVLGAGDVFGELAVLQENAMRSADAQALVETECFVLHRRALVAFLVAHPAGTWRASGRSGHRAAVTAHAGRPGRGQPRERQPRPQPFCCARRDQAGARSRHRAASRRASPPGHLS